ncbi:major facilitator superfamily domain-containing protein [Colletotrichum lupini]|nr:major facilitator superfamily domain-containing protein [Colletotrichum lupini]
MMPPAKPASSSEILESLNSSHILTEPGKTRSLQVEGQKEDSQTAVEASTAYRKDIRFWVIVFALCITSLLASLETTVVVTSLPTIVERLKFGSSYVWVGNIFFLTSGICGGASSPTMLIAGRAVQGMGSGGINMIIDIIISDLVPLRDRGNYIAIILAIYGVGMAIGPFVGGIIVQTTSWRWVFYINLPVGGLSLVLLYLFLHVKWDRTATFNGKLRRIDYIGNSILIASTVSVLIALTWGGEIYSWSSYRVIIPLVLGLVGLVAFCIFEGSGIVPEPVMPLRLLANRTSAIIYATTFLNSAILYWAFFFLPLYFQAVKLSTPARSGVQLLPVTLISIPGAAISAVVLARWGRYKALHIAGFALMTLGLGIWAVLDRYSSTAAWVLVQVVPAVGSGMLLNTLLPAFQAGLAEADQAAATASWSFIRSFGSIWGVAIPAAIFNTYTLSYAAQKIDDPAARGILQHGNAYASATKAFVESFDEPTRSQIIDLFTEAMRKVFLIAIAFGGLAFLLSFLEREVELRKELETEFGLEEKKNADGNKDAV